MERIYNILIAAVILIVATYGFVPASLVSSQGFVLSQTKWDILKDEEVKTRLSDQILFRGGVWFKGFNISDGGFGELSALHVTRDGSTLLAISDHDGQWLRADILYTATGELDSIRYSAHGALLNESGKPLLDIEAITQIEDRFLLALDDRGLIMSYDAELQDPQVFSTLPDFVLQKNAGIEAITYVENVGLVCIAEKQCTPLRWFSDDALARQRVSRDQTRAMWILSEDGSVRKTLAYHSDNFHPSDAVTLASGNMLVIHRPDFTGKNNMRLVHVSKETLLRADIMVHGETLIELTTRGTNQVLDNFESLASFTREGREFLFLLSDDNLNPGQKTLLLLFELNLH